MAKFFRWIDRLSLYIALAAAWTAMLGSLYFSEVKGYVPCDLCWYQRILMYPLTVILAIGISVRDKWIPRIVLPLSTLGMFVSGYHYLLEKTDFFAKDSFCRAGVSCVTVWINWFGFITIPFLALTAFTIITFMCVVAILAREPRQVDENYGGELVDLEAEIDGALVEVEEEAADWDPEMERAWPDRPWLAVAIVVAVIVLIFNYLYITGWQERERAAALVEAMETPLSSAAVTGEMSTVDAEDGSTSAIAEGQELYALHCASCHGPNAKGVQSLGTALAPSNAFVLEHTDAEIVAMIQQGRDLSDPANTSGLVMPPNGGAPNLTESDLQAIIAYLRSIE